MKLESLKDRPATKEDIGKTVYYLNGDILKVCVVCLHPAWSQEYIVAKDTVEKYHYYLSKEHIFWQKPVVVSEELLKEAIDILRGLDFCAGACASAQQKEARMVNFINEAEAVLNGKLY